MLGNLPPGVHADDAANAADDEAAHEAQTHQFAQVPKSITADRRSGKDAKFVHKTNTWRICAASAMPNSWVNKMHAGVPATFPVYSFQERVHCSRHEAIVAPVEQESAFDPMG